MGQVVATVIAVWVLVNALSVVVLAYKDALDWADRRSGWRRAVRVALVGAVGWGLMFGAIDGRLAEPGNWAFAAGAGGFLGLMLLVYPVRGEAESYARLSRTASHAVMAGGFALVTAASWTLGEYAVGVVGLVVPGAVIAWTERRGVPARGAA